MHLPPARRLVPAALATALALPLAALQQPSGGAPPALEPPPPASERAPAGLAAVIDGEVEIPLEAYRDYLFRADGRGPLQELVYAALLEREAERVGVVVAPEAVDAAVEAAWSNLLDLRHAGDEAALAAELWAAGFDVDEHRANLRDYQRRELLESAISVATRGVDEAALRARFDADYGVDGVRVVLRHVFWSHARLRTELARAGEPNDAAAVRAAALERAAAVLDELHAGADFATVAARESHDLAAPRTGGEIPGYNYRRYGEALAEAARAAPVGEPFGPVETAAGFHVAVVESRVETAFEDVRAELAERLRAAEATWDERAALRRRLFDEADVVTY